MQPAQGRLSELALYQKDKPWQIGQVDKDASIKPMMVHLILVGLACWAEIREVHTLPTPSSAVVERGAWVRKNSHDERQKGLLGKQGKQERVNSVSWE
jgi:hypothetical protein